MQRQSHAQSGEEISVCLYSTQSIYSTRWIISDKTLTDTRWCNVNPVLLYTVQSIIMSTISEQLLGQICIFLGQTLLGNH